MQMMIDSNKVSLFKKIVKRQPGIDYPIIGKALPGVFGL